MRNYEEMYEYLKQNNAEHLLKFYNELSKEEQESLFAQIETIDFDLMKSLYANRDVIPDDDKEIEPISFTKFEDISDADKARYITLGEEVIKNKKLAVCQLAGGQGSRLGHKGPKGTFIVELATPKSIFEIFSEKLHAVYEKYGVKIQWYVMTSEDNDAETQGFFTSHNYFDYGKENITFFKQGELPLLNYSGNPVLTSKSKVFMAADGNGGVYEALRKNNILEELEANGVEYLGIGNVDNILIDFFEPTFLGMMVEQDRKIAMKSVTKVSPEEKVGVACKINGKPGVVEYTEISEEMANLRDENGNLVYGESYFGFAVYKTSFLKEIAKGLTYHVAKKKNSYIDEEGNEVVGEEPNTYKFEMFIFEGFGFADDMLVLSVDRKKNFAPIKNKEGQDSPETAIKLYNDFINR